MSRVLIFDTETLGLLPKKGRGFDNYEPYTALSKYDRCRLQSICWKVFTTEGVCLKTYYAIIKPKDFVINDGSEAVKIHGITAEIASLGNRYRERT